ncbi:conserved hypothetical protein [uncultured Desulfatiglans sp.]|uniref:Pyruvate formate-lyase activating enzyme n=1 Tax=Uncultured Desulfatiglans sp. TaxID=1748965 RepID=A0A653AH81_UNCDX|nr:conserved hypothetical protein [uncultured Desulfatiglans sp.]
MPDRGRYLLIDVGAGTMDVLYWDAALDIHYKAVVKSPVRRLAEEASAIEGDILITGCEMGGGALGSILRGKADSARVVMTTEAAATLHHDMGKVRSWGIEVVDTAQALERMKNPGLKRLELADVDPERIRRLVESFGVPFAFDCVGLCAQDHGVAPPGVSHLDFRHRLFTEILDRSPSPSALLYRAEEVPAAMNRLKSLAESARKLPVEEGIYVMDSGMAAILGASRDRAARGKEKILVLDVATSHTVGAALERDEIVGFFEYHTRDITASNLDRLLKDLPEGRLSHEEILREGGHGAYTRRRFPWEDTLPIIATGPKRALLKDSRLPIVYGAPFGDNMMTGCGGLLEAIRGRQGLDPAEIV